MKRRSLFAGIALVALLLSFAGSSLAAACDLAMAESHDAAGPVESGHSAHGAPTPAHEDADPASQDHCPFTAAMGGSCNGSVSLPSGAASILFQRDELRGNIRSSVVFPATPSADRLFHPPKL